MIEELEIYKRFLDLQDKVRTLDYSSIIKLYFKENKFELLRIDIFCYIIKKYLSENREICFSILNNISDLFVINSKFRKIIYTDCGRTIRRGRLYKRGGKTVLALDQCLTIKIKPTNDIEIFTLDYINKINTSISNIHSILDSDHRNDIIEGLNNKYTYQRNLRLVYESIPNLILNSIYIDINETYNLDSLYKYDKYVFSKIESIRQDLVSIIVKLKLENKIISEINLDLKEKKNKYNLINGL